MEWLRLTLALGLPATLGLSLAATWIPAARRRACLVAGYGLVMTLVLWPLVLRLCAALGAGPGFHLPLVFALLLIVGLQIRLWRSTPVTPAPREVKPPLFAAGWLPRALCLLLLALLSLRLFSLAQEVLWRPVYPWDATMHWATKARVWFELQDFVPFVSNDEWLRRGGEGVFTDHHPGYPVTVPLWQYWVSTALGRWDPALINLPWLLCYLGLGLAFMGQAREAGASRVESLVFTTFLLTLPLLNTHVALAGYADLFLGACYGLALMALHAASRGGQRWQWLLVFLFACACPLIKNEGFFWMLTLLPGCWVAWRRDATSILLAILGVSAAVPLVLWLFPADVSVAGHSLNSLDLAYRPGSLEGIFTSLLVLDNWHLTFWYFCLLLVLVIWRRPGVLQAAGPVMAALAAAGILFLCLFTVTEYAVGAVRQTAVGRITLQLVPGFLFLLLLLHLQLHRDEPA